MNSVGALNENNNKHFPFSPLQLYTIHFIHLKLWNDYQNRIYIHCNNEKTATRTQKKQPMFAKERTKQVGMSLY